MLHPASPHQRVYVTSSPQESSPSLNAPPFFFHAHTTFTTTTIKFYCTTLITHHIHTHKHTLESVFAFLLNVATLKIASVRPIKNV